MGSDVVEFMSEVFDDDPSLCHASKPFLVQTLISELAVEAFVECVLPRATWLDVRGFDSSAFEPILNGVGHKLWSVVGTNACGRSAF